MPPHRSARSGRAKHASTIDSRPLSGVFAINKPSGPTSSELLDRLKPLLARSSLFKTSDGRPVPLEGRMFKKTNRQPHIPPKIGHGGTLDPLADGVLVIGVNGGTKACGQFQACTKEYATTALLGSSTTSYDKMDPILYRAPHTHVTPAVLEAALDKFKGSIQQAPPLYSAVRIEGKRLFEYARQNLPLPRPIPVRDVTVDQLILTSFQPAGEHPYAPPEKEVPEEEKELVGRVRALAGEASPERATSPPAEPSGEPSGEPPAANKAEKAEKEKDDERSIPPAAFSLEMTVGGGTYVRSIVHDLARSVGSAAHVVSLTRLRQAEFAIPYRRHGQELAPGNTIEWSVFERALAQLDKETQGPAVDAAPKPDVSPEEKPAENGSKSESNSVPTKPELADWEIELLRHFIPK